MRIRTSSSTPGRGTATVTRLALAATLLVGGGAIAGGAAAASPAGTTPEKLFVQGRTSFVIHPDSAPRYTGNVDYTKVTSVTPRDVPVPRKMAAKARAACLKAFRYGGPRLFPHVEVFTAYPNGSPVRLTTAGDHVIDATGGWGRNGFLPQSYAKVVTARAAFWTDAYYNAAKNDITVSITHGGKRIEVDCDGEMTAKLPWP